MNISKLIRFFSWFTILLLILEFLIIILIPIAPKLATAYFNNNGKESSGHKLYIEDIDVNYFTASITIKNFFMFEAKCRQWFIHG